MAVLGAAMVLACPLAFGPSQQAHCRVTAFNAWTYALGRRLPSPLGIPPYLDGITGLLVPTIGLTRAEILSLAADLRRGRRLAVLGAPIRALLAPLASAGPPRVGQPALHSPESLVQRLDNGTRPSRSSVDGGFSAEDGDRSPIRLRRGGRWRPASSAPDPE